MTRKVVNEAVPNDKGMVERPPALPDAAMKAVLLELRALALPFRPSNEKRTISFQSLYAFLLAVRALGGGPSAHLDVYDEGVGGARQFSLIYTAHRAGGVVFLRVTDDNARFALARNAGLFLRREEQPRAPNGKIGYAEFDTSHPVNQRAVNRVLHGLPAEVSEGGDAA